MDDESDEPSTALRGRLTKLLRRASLNLVDQVVSAITNVVLSIVVAHQVGVRGYGAFAVAFLVFTVLVGLERSLVGTPMSMRFSAAEGEERQRAVGGALAAALLLAVASAVLIGAAGLLAGEVLRPSLLALALVTPGLVVQDACRMVFFAHRRPGRALFNDVLWAVVQFAAMAVLSWSGVRDPGSYILAWGGAATLAAVVGLVHLATVPRVAHAWWWITAQLDVSGYLLMEYLVGAGGAQGSVLLVGALGTLDDVGSFRAAQTLLGPLGIISTAIATFALPEISRRTELSAAIRQRAAAALSAAVVVVSLAYTGLALLVPEDLGTALLKDTWTGAHSVLLPLALASSGAGACLGPSIVIYAMGQARRTFLLHVLEAPLVLTCVVIGQLAGGAPGAAWGMAINMTIMVPLWFWQLRSLLRTSPLGLRLASTDGR